MRKEGQTELGGGVVIGIIIALLAMLLIIAIHFKLTSEPNTQISAITGGGGVAGLALANRKKGAIPPTLLIIVMSLIIIFVISFTLWNGLSAEGQKEFVRTFSYIGDAIGTTVYNIIPGTA